MKSLVAIWLAVAVLAEDPKLQTFDLEGVKREALVVANSPPAPAAGAPLVFVFHGHGGAARNTARRLSIHTLWPQAVVAYMQGIPGIAGINDADARRSGWQKEKGQLGDRDVKFVDVALTQLAQQHKIDPHRVYALGHSNGARFVNLLWNMRGDRFAALCSAAAQGGALLREVTPKPIFMIAGEQDPLVPLAGQKLSIDFVCKLLQVDESKAKSDGHARMMEGINGTELVTYVHPGGHEFPPAALPMVVSFFQRHARK